MMSAVKSKDSKAELALRKELWKAGFRYRLHRNDIFGRPDIVFIGKRIAVFVDSDWWHARILLEEGEAALRAHLRTPRRDWWIAKLRRNAERDKEVTRYLRRDGWRVVRIWESDILRDPKKAAARVEKAFVPSTRRS